MAKIKLNKRYKYAGDIVKALLNRLQWTLEDATEFINSIEDADVVEVKHGEWIDKFNGKFVNLTYICSVCGEKALLECYINELDRWEYRQSLSIRCPHCGAKMDGGKAE